MKSIFYGKKTVLFPFNPKVDMNHFVSLHMNDKHGMMCKYCLKDMTEQEAILYVSALVSSRQIHVWTVMTKGKDAKRAGFIYLDDVTTFSAGVSGIMDLEFVKNLDKHMRKGKYTYSEDALITMIDAAFEQFNLLRIESNLVGDNRLGRALHKRVGFVKEGVLRKSFKIDDQYKDIVLMAILKEEWNNGQGRINVSRGAEVQPAGKD